MSKEKTQGLKDVLHAHARMHIYYTENLIIYNVDKKINYVRHKIILNLII